MDKSIIPSCDVSSLENLKELVEKTHEIEQISSYKVGFELALRFGLPQTVSVIKKISDKPVIYDHQKAGNDIPEMGEKFASACRESGIDAVIIFPFTGPKSEEAWIDAINKEKLGLIVGAEMTHEKFLTSSGGFIDDSVPEKIFALAAKKGVSNFVVPGNKPEKMAHYKKFLEKRGVKPVFFVPGLIAQGGTIEGARKALGSNYHAIVGRSLYGAKDIRKSAQGLADSL